jgi:repressor LexA
MCMHRYPLTHKQARVLEVITKHITKKGASPTLNELRKALGVSSLRTVTQYLESLERKGYIVRRKHARRNIELRNLEEGGQQAIMITVPVVANVGCDDLSVFATETHDEFLEIDKELVQNSEDIVAVRAVGDSMQDAGIQSGDYILVQFTENVQNGDRVAAIIGDMVTVKRLERIPGTHGQQGMTVLHPESKDPRYKPIILRENFKITGKVLCVIPSPRMEITEVVPLPEYEDRY